MKLTLFNSIPYIGAASPPRFAPKRCLKSRSLSLDIFNNYTAKIQLYSRNGKVGSWKNDLNKNLRKILKSNIFIINYDKCRLEKSYYRLKLSGESTQIIQNQNKKSSNFTEISRDREKINCSIKAWALATINYKLINRRFVFVHSIKQNFLLHRVKILFCLFNPYAIFQSFIKRFSRIQKNKTGYRNRFESITDFKQSSSCTVFECNRVLFLSTVSVPIEKPFFGRNTGRH
ncbi:hypothetical protein BpHYR1_038996 [Brachionus plicatilis]|uniref:Uncharacterized protein n=1 Tax=Brachionus plicatilis TaxID=10195 RepID=A0A3M7RD12_BRAPC|nr:hypothetical protein BpHYR1_038996 [Brachionus plicatilis]